MKSKRIRGFALFCAAIFSTATFCLADLDEQGFDGYSEGELLGQNGWRPQGMGESGSYLNARDRVEVKIEPATGNKFVVWNSGFGDREQTRTVKVYPPTSGTKVAVKFDFLPGSTDVGGQLAFDRGGVVGSALRFRGGTLHVANFGEPTPVDTGVAFNVKDWNNLEMQFDLDAHKVEVFLNGGSVGTFSLSPMLIGLSQLNIFAGGEVHESALDNLSIESVDSFTSPSTQSSTSSK